MAELRKIYTELYVTHTYIHTHIHTYIHKYALIYKTLKRNNIFSSYSFDIDMRYYASVNSTIAHPPPRATPGHLHFFFFKVTLYDETLILSKKYFFIYSY
jgi:hypothetical protein